MAVPAITKNRKQETENWAQSSKQWAKNRRLRCRRRQYPETDNRKQEPNGMALTPIEEVMQDLRQGKMIILVDDEDRENEGDLTMAAELVTPEAINFMVRFGRGLVCLALEADLVERLKLPQMVRDNQSGFKTAFCVSIEARRGVTTGISAADRATTVLTAVADHTKAEDLVSPGHVFPIRARRGGVLVRTGQTEGSVDLTRLSGLKGAAVICEVMKDDGTMARMPDLEKFAQEHRLKIATIADLVEYRLRHESFVHRRASVKLPTYFGEFTAIAYDNDVDDNQHVALVKGEIAPDQPVLVRVIPNASPATFSIPCAATVGTNWKPPCNWWSAKAEASSCTCTRRAGASAWSISCGPTNCRTRAPIRWKPTKPWVLRRTCGITASGPKSCATWESARCA